MFEKEEFDSEVEEYMEGLEEEEMAKKELKMPSDLEDDYDEEDDLADMGEEGEEEGEENIFGNPDGADQDLEFPEEEEKVKATNDAEDELEGVFANAWENNEMDIVDQLRKKVHSGEFINKEAL